MKTIVVLGCGRPVGGGNVENAATCLLWRSLGIPVTIIPASPQAPKLLVG